MGAGSILKNRSILRCTLRQVTTTAPRNAIQIMM